MSKKIRKYVTLDTDYPSVKKDVYFYTRDGNDEGHELVCEATSVKAAKAIANALNNFARSRARMRVH